MNVCQLNVVSILLLLLALSGCSGTTVESSSEGTSNSDDDHIYTHFISTGFLNGDKYKDSVVVEVGRDTSFFSIFLGTKDGGYKLFKKYPCENYWDELGVNIHGDTISCHGYGISYNFMYVSGDFKLVSYEWSTEGGPIYILDFDKKQMTLVVEFPEIISRSIDIENDKIPDSYSISDVFKEEYNKYLHYDESFIYSKIENHVGEYKNEIEEGKTINSEKIDNDTLLFFSEEIKYDEKTFLLSMSIDRRGLTPTLERIFETEMCAMLDKESKHAYENVIEAYDARKEEWLEECDFENEPDCYIDNYFINKIGEYKDLSTYNIGTFHNDQYSGRGGENERFITYNKNTGNTFTWDMIQKEEGLHNLMIEGLKKYYHADSVEDMWINEDYQKGEYIPFPKNPPIIMNDSLSLQFHRFEITGVWGAGWPCATIPLDRVIPYLTDEGKDFLDISGR